ncbi:MAG: hypothetical protein C0392_04405 [Syntrophus sp. (in: bacteria)]|nr:hypothetical protein [Syntrophus sp. (in: bacteria)]
MNSISQEHAYSKYILPVLIGAGATVTAIALDELKIQTALAVLGAVSFLVVLSFIASRKNLSSFAVILLALGIPFNIDVNLFYREYVGVTSLDIGLSLLSAIALFVLFFYEHYTSRGSGPAFRYNRTLLWAPILYMMSGLLSLYNATSNELAVLELVRLAMLFVIFFVVMNMRDRKLINTFIVTLSITVVLQTLIAYYQYKTGQVLGLGVLGERDLGTREVWYAGSRASGTIGHPNILAYYFEILIPFMFAMFLVEENRWLRLWYLIVTVAGLFGIMTTLSRGGWASVPVSMAVVFLTLIRHRLKGVRSIVGLFMISMLLLGIFFYLLPTIEKRLSFADYGSAATRAPLNRAAFSVIKQFPVSGVGLNNLAKVFKTYDTTGGSSLFRTSTHVVHNLFLAVWAETGTIGILTFVWMFVATMIVAIKTLFKSVPLWQQGILIGAVAGLLAQMIHGMVDPGFRILMNVSMLVYAMFGLVGAISVLNKFKNERPAIDSQYK